MNRLQKKCFIAATALHMLLLGILLFGSAFFVPSRKADTQQMLKAYDPSLVTDALNSSGGNPNVSAVPPSAPAPAPPAPPVPQVQPPTPAPTPAPPKVEVPKVVEPPKVKPLLTPKDLDPIKPKETVRETPKPTPPKLAINPDELKPIKRPAIKPDKDSSNSDAKAKLAAADAKRRLAKEFGKSITSLSKDLSSITAVEPLPGPGGGGPLSAAYKDVVASTYTAAWSPPADLSDESATVTVSVTIASDGHVANGHITKPSGNAAMDRSIRNTLETVTFIQPFPEGATDRERTYNIKFNLQAKRLIG
ncbi:MAG: TonB family protein [Pedosphaera sp.]|nr:TonB family protein [Pedosphaera sp.]